MKGFVGPVKCLLGAGVEMAPLFFGMACGVIGQRADGFDLFGGELAQVERSGWPDGSSVGVLGVLDDEGDAAVDLGDAGLGPFDWTQAGGDAPFKQGGGECSCRSRGALLEVGEDVLELGLGDSALPE